MSKVSDDGKLVFSAGGNLYLLDVIQNAVSDLIVSDGVAERWPYWSSDGNRVYYSACEEDTWTVRKPGICVWNCEVQHFYSLCNIKSVAINGTDTLQHTTSERVDDRHIHNEHPVTVAALRPAEFPLE